MNAQTKLKQETFTIKGGQVTIENRRAGYIHCLKNGTLAFITHRKRTEHYFRMYRGYGLNAELIVYLLEHKVKKILIVEDRKRKLLSDVGDWLRLGFKYHKIGFEPQRVLSEDLMLETDGAIK